MLKKSPALLACGLTLSGLLLGYGQGAMNVAYAQGAPDPGAPDKGAKGPGKAGDASGKAKKDPFKKPGTADAKGAPAGKAPGGKDPGGKMAGQKGAPGGPVKGSPMTMTPGQASPLGAPAAKGAPGAPGTPPVVKLPPSKKGFDPFKIVWHKLPPPPYIFDNIVGPLRVASVDVEIPPAGKLEIHEVPDRRVSGIMSGDGVFAILETAGSGDTEIVKPGMPTKDGYRVVSITADSVRLERTDGNVTRIQDVPLTDQSFAPASGGLFGGGAGNPGGGVPGSTGFPGGGRPGSTGFPGGGRPGPRPGGGKGGGAFPGGSKAD